jgi:hypothetical protein
MLLLKIVNQLESSEISLSLVQTFILMKQMGQKMGFI